MISVRSSANTPSKAMPTIRNGSEMSQTTGHRISASNASGQHTTSNSSHSRSYSIRPPSARAAPGAARRP